MILSHAAYCDHLWCIKFNDVHVAIREATRMGLPRTLYFLEMYAGSDNCTGKNDVCVIINPTMYTNDEICRASGDDLIEMKARNYAQVQLAKRRHNGTLEIICRGKRVDGFRSLKVHEYHALSRDGHGGPIRRIPRPPMYFRFPLRVILEIESIFELGTCACDVLENIENMMPEEYLRYIMRLPIHRYRLVRHTGPIPTAPDHAWTLMLPYLEKFGLLEYIDATSRREIEYPRCRDGYIQICITTNELCVYVADSEIIVRPCLTDSQQYIFEVTLTKPLPRPMSCKCGRIRNGMMRGVSDVF